MTRTNYVIKIRKADLWGNVKDGFDNNGNVYYGTEHSLVISEQRMRTIARNWFEGHMLARTENRVLPVQRKDIVVELESDDPEQPVYAVFHKPTGTYLGELSVGLFS